MADGSVARAGTIAGVGAEFGAVVLAGGRARRFGGVDKVGLAVAGRSLLDRTLHAVRDADPIVVVGPRRATAAPVLWTREEPSGGGPLAGLRAGLDVLPVSGAPVAVLAADYPYLASSTISRLLDAAGTHANGAILVDSEGMPQWLVGVWRARALRDAMPTRVAGQPVRALLAPLNPVLVPATGAEASDVDTPEELRRVNGDS